MVRQAEVREKEFGIGAGIEGQLSFIFKKGGSTLEEYTLPQHSQSMSPHSLWRMPLPRESIKPWRRGAGAMLDNIVSIKIYNIVSIEHR